MAHFATIVSFMRTLIPFFLQSAAGESERDSSASSGMDSSSSHSSVSQRPQLHYLSMGDSKLVRSAGACVCMCVYVCVCVCVCARACVYRSQQREPTPPALLPLSALGATDVIKTTN